MVKWHHQEEAGAGAGCPVLLPPAEGLLDIAISDDASSTVIHVRGPVSARMSDVGCVFDKLGVDVISCSTMPTSSSCDMTLVVVDRSDSQPLDEALKHSVTEGLQRVFHAHRQRSQTDSPSSSSSSLQGPGPVLRPPAQGSSAGSSCAGHTAAAAAAAVERSQPGTGSSNSSSSGDGGSSSSSGGGGGSGATGLEAGRADSAPDSIHTSKAPSMQPSIGSDAPTLDQQPGSSRQASLDAPSISLPLVLSSLTRAESAGGQAGAAHSSSSREASRTGQPQQAPVVRFSSENSVCTVPAAAPLQLHRSGSGRPLKPALRIDIPSDSDSSSSSRRQNDNSTSSNSNTTNGRQAQQQQQASSSSARSSLPAQQPTRQPQQGGFPVQDLTRRLLELGMHRHSAAAAAGGGSSSDEDDGDADASRSISCRSGGSSISARGSMQAPSCKWQKVERANSKSCGDLLQLAAQQQLACMQRASDLGPGAGEAAAAAAGAGAGLLSCFGTSCASLDGVLGGQGDSSRSLGSVDLEQQPMGVRRMLAMSPAAGLPGAAPGSSSSSSQQWQPPPRTPSRIILSPVAVDGSGDFSGQPKLFVSIPKSGEERRSRRSSHSIAATPRVPFTPAGGGIAMLTPASAGVRATNALKQPGSGLLGRTPQQAPLSPRAAAAVAEAAAKLPYNVAVAAAQLLSSTNSVSAQEAAAAVVAAAAEKGDSSTPLPSPLHGSGAAAQRFSSDDDTGPLSPRVPRTSPCSFQHPPPTPVHPAVAAAAAAAITAAADAAVQAQALAHLQLHGDDDEDGDEPLRLPQLGLPACLSPQRRSFHVGSAGSDAALQRSPSPVAAATAAAAAGLPAASMGPGTILEGSEGDTVGSGASSSSEEWWCGELTGMCVADIMVGPIKAVPADADLTQAKQLMMQHNLPGMLVDTGPGQAPGFLTRGDFFKAMLRRRSSRKRAQKPCVRDIMGPVLVVQRDMSIESAAQAMQEAGVRHAAVQDRSAAAAAAAVGEGDGGDQSSSSSANMASYVGLVSDAAIYRCLGLYPDDAGAGEEGLLEEGLLGLPHALRLHSGLDSSFDSSAGTDTPLSSRSRVATPLLDSSRDGGGGQQQQQERQLSVSDAATSGQQSRQASLARLPDIALLREGPGGRDGSTASSLGSVRSAAAGGGGGAGSAAGAGASKSVAGGVSDAEGAVTRSGSCVLAATGSDGSNALLPDGCGAAAAAGAEGPPDALARYKHAAALWEVELDDLEMIKRIGEGSFGEVMLATYRGTKVAVKRLRVLDIDDVRAPNEQYAADGSGSATSSSGGSQRAMGASQAAFRQFFEREIAILASIRHPNVVNFIGACHKPGQRCLVTEFCARGSLDQVLHKSGLALDLTKRLEFALDIVRGMACLHAQRPIIIHRDLKTANLLVSARFEVKVADFGLSRIKDASHLQVSRAGLEGTIEYCAPEVLRGEPYTERCDVYSFGVVLWELLLRQRPYSDAEVPVFLLMVNIGNGTLSLAEVPVESATPGLVELVRHCLSFSAADRPEFREVLATLEQEYRALRARQPPRPQQQQQHAAAAAAQHQQQQQQLLLLHAGEHRRCDSASWLAGGHQLHVTADSPDPGGTPVVQSPAGTFGLTSSSSSHVPPALTPPGTGLRGAAAAGGSEQDPYALQQQQQPQRHRLSQGDSGLQSASSGGSAAPSFGFGLQQGLQPAASATPQMQAPQQQYPLPFGQQQQQVFSVPLPQLQLHLQQPQQVFVASACSSPRHQQPQQFAVPVLPQLHVMSAFASANLGLQQQQSFTGQQQQQQAFVGQQQQHGVPSAGPGGTAAGTSLKPPRHKQQLSRARSLPAPHAVTWDLEGAGAEAGEGQQGGHWPEDMLQIQEEAGAQDLLLFGEDSFGGLSNRSTTYSPCPSGQLCMLVESTGSSTYGSGSGPAGLVQCQQPQQQVLLTQNGQQVAVHQVPVQPVLIQQPGGQIQQAFIQQPAYAAVAQAPQQQPQPQQAARMLQRALGTPSPTPAAVLGRSGTPLSSSPSPGLNPLPIMAAVGAAAAAARREGSGSGAGSPRGVYAGAAGAAGHDSRSSSSQGGGHLEMPPVHLLQIGEPLGSRGASPQRPLRRERLSSERGGGGGRCGTPPSTAYSSYSSYSNGPAQQGHAPAAVVVHAGGPALVTPLLLQRLDSLHRSGSSGCSPSCLHRSSSPGLQPSGEPQGQLLGLLVPGYCSGPNSPRSHSPQRGPASAVAEGHTPPAAGHQHLSRHGSSRLAVSISGSHELPLGTAAALAAAGGGPGEGYLGTSPAMAAAAAAGAPYGVPQAGAGVPGRSDCCQAVPVYGFNVVHAPVGHVYHHHQYPQPHASGLQPSVRRAHSTLRNDSNSRDGSRALSPFASMAGAAPAEPYGNGPSAGGAAAAAAAGVAGVPGAVAAAPAGTCSRTLSPCAAASSWASSRSLDDVACRDRGADVHSTGQQAATAAAAAAGRCGPTPARYVSPFAAAAARREDDGDRDAVVDARSDRDSRPASPAPGTNSKHAGSKAAAAAGSAAAAAAAGADGTTAAAAATAAAADHTPTRLASPFALMQQEPAQD